MFNDDHLCVERLQGECRIKNVQLYGYEDVCGVFERAALIIDSKLHWLDIQDFCLDELKPNLEAVGLCLNAEEELWGIYNGLIGDACIEFYITTFSRAETDINTLVTTTHKSISNLINESNAFWSAIDLIEEYELGESLDYQDE